MSPAPCPSRSPRSPRSPRPPSRAVAGLALLLLLPTGLAVDRAHASSTCSDSQEIGALASGVVIPLGSLLAVGLFGSGSGDFGLGVAHHDDPTALFGASFAARSQARFLGRTSLFGARFGYWGDFVGFDTDNCRLEALYGVDASLVFRPYQTGTLEVLGAVGLGIVSGDAGPSVEATVIAKLSDVVAVETGLSWTFLLGDGLRHAGRLRAMAIFASGPIRPYLSVEGSVLPASLWSGRSDDLRLGVTGTVGLRFLVDRQGSVR